MAQNEYAVRLEHVTKTFGPVVANKDVSLGCLLYTSRCV